MDHTEEEGLLYAFVLNILLFLVQLGAALFSGSLALLAESLHVLSDIVGLGSSYIIKKLSGRDADSYMTYGYKRLNVIGGTINILLIISVSFYIAYEAVTRIGNDISINLSILMVAGLVGIVVNLISAFFVHGFDSINTRGAFLHLALDIIGSLLVTISAIIIYFTSIFIIDIIVSIVIVGMVLYSIKDISIESFNILIQKSPHDINKIENKVLEIDEIDDIHHTHLWRLDSKNNVMSTHVISNYENQEELRKNIKEKLEEYNISHMTIQIEKE